MPGQEAAGNRRGAAGLPNFRCTLLAWLVCGRAWPVRDQETVPRVWRCGAHNGARAEGQPGGGEVRRSLTWQGSLSDQDHPAAHSEAGSESAEASSGSKAGCSVEDSRELAALAQHGFGADGRIPRCAGCDERVGLWFGGCNISSFGRRRPVSQRHPGSPLRVRDGRPRPGWLPSWCLLRSCQRHGLGALCG